MTHAPLSTQEINTLVLRPLRIQFGVPKSIKDEADKAEFLRQWQNALAFYPQKVLQAATEKAITREEFFPRISTLCRYADAEMRHIRSLEPPTLPAPQPCQEDRRAVEAWYKTHVPIFRESAINSQLLKTMCTFVAFNCKTPEEAHHFVETTTQNMRTKPSDEAMAALENFLKAFTQFLNTEK